jgi:subtilisin-like proprotein convertase family protein
VKVYQSPRVNVLSVLHAPEPAGFASFSAKELSPGVEELGLEIGPSCAAPATLGCTAQACAAPLQVTLTADTTYSVRITTAPGNARRSAFVFSAAPPAAASGAETCATPTVIPSTGGRFIADLSGVPEGSATCGTAAGPDVYFSVVPQSTYRWAIDTCDSALIDTILSVHTGCPATATNQIASACDDDGCAAGDTRSRLEVTLSAGAPYIIRVASKTTQLPILPRVLLSAIPNIPPPANDSWCSASAWTPGPGERVGYTLGATQTPSGGTPNTAIAALYPSLVFSDPLQADVWNSWTAYDTGLLSVVPMTPGMGVAVYPAGSCPGLPGTATNAVAYGQRATIPVTAGQSLWFRTGRLISSTAIDGVVDISIEPFVGACCVQEACTLTTSTECGRVGGTFRGLLSPCNAQASTPVDFAPAPGLPLAIPNGSTVSSTITVPMNFNLARLAVEVQINHESAGDLTITLSKEGSSVVLLGRLANAARSNGLAGWYWFTDDATQTLATAAGALTSTTEFIPGGRFLASDASGQPVALGSVFPASTLTAGTWTLTVQDSGPTQAGTLVYWRLLLFLDPTVSVCNPSIGVCCTGTSFSVCSLLSPTVCASQAGTYSGATVCQPTSCAAATGACCETGTGVCTTATQAACVAGSVWYGSGASCESTNCPDASGACCLPSGACIAATRASCQTPSAGSFQGAGLPCASVVCAQPFGACCGADGSCTSMTEGGCRSASLQASWLGAGAACGSAIPCPPGTFTLVAPVSQATGVLLNPILDWTDAPGATSYIVLVDEDSAFGSPEIAATVISSQYIVPTPSPLRPGTVYNWKVRAQRSGAFRSGTPAQMQFITTFPRPGVFDIAAPAAGALNVPLLPTLSWAPSASAYDYQLRLDDDADFSSPLIVVTITQTSYLLTVPLPEGRVFYWQVTARNGAGQTPAATSPSAFSTLINPPQAFTLTLPTDGAVAQPTQPVFSWAPSTSAAEYQITIDDTIDFSSPVLTQTVDTTTFTPPFGVLASNRQYFWRVLGRNAVGQIASSPASRTFITSAPSAGSFALTSPAVGATGVSRVPLLDWASASGSSLYGVELATDSGFANRLLNTTTTVSQYQVPTGMLSSGQTYYWRVNAFSGGLPTLSTPGIASFTTSASAAPDVPTLVFPADGAAGLWQPPAFLFQWNTASGATSHRVELATASSFSPASIVYSQSLPSPSNLGGPSQSEWTAALRRGETYWWRVVAVGAGETPSNMRSFTTQTPLLPGAFSLGTPSGSATSAVSTTPLFTWTLSADAHDYLLEVDDNADFSSPALTVAVPAPAVQYQTPGASALLSGRQYFWRVTARNITGQTLGSAPTSFWTALLPPGPFGLISPAPASTGVSRGPKLDWFDASGATQYLVQVSTDPSFTTLTVNAGVGVLTSGALAPSEYPLSAGQLAGGQLFYWRIAARTIGFQSPWVVGSFTTSTLPAPGTFSLLSFPANGATPRLDWTDATDAQTYDVWIGVLVNSQYQTIFETSGVVGSAFDVPPGVLSLGVTYRWRIVARNINGTRASTPSESVFATSAPIAPGAFTLISPGPGASTSLTPTLSWQPSPNAISYTLLVDDNPDLSSPEIAQVLTATSYTVPSGALRRGVTWWWKVTASSSLLTTAASPIISSFTIPECLADFDNSGNLAVADIFTFLNAWFGGNPNANFDGVNGLQVADIFAFLNAWFAGCP